MLVIPVSVIAVGNEVEVTQRSGLTGKLHTLTLPLTHSQFLRAISRAEAGWSVGEAFPNLSLDQTEFMMTGITADEWAAGLSPPKPK